VRLHRGPNGLRGHFAELCFGQARLRVDRFRPAGIGPRIATVQLEMGRADYRGRYFHSEWTLVPRR